MPRKPVSSMIWTTNLNKWHSGTLTDCIPSPSAAETHFVYCTEPSSTCHGQKGREYCDIFNHNIRILWMLWYFFTNKIAQSIQLVKVTFSPFSGARLIYEKSTQYLLATTSKIFSATRLALINL